MSEWSDCPRGEVGQLVLNLRRRQRNQIWLQSAGIAAGLLLLIGFAGWWLRWDSTPRIACRQVRELSEQFVAGRLDDETNQIMVVHLQHCRSCVDYVKQEHPNFHLPRTDQKTNQQEIHAAHFGIDRHQFAVVNSMSVRLDLRKGLRNGRIEPTRNR